jgi:hypothetical protein
VVCQDSQCCLSLELPWLEAAAHPRVQSSPLGSLHLGKETWDILEGHPAIPATAASHLPWLGSASPDHSGCSQVLSSINLFQSLCQEATHDRA